MAIELLEKTEQLLPEIKLLLNQELILKQEKEIRGENFNVFEIMKAQSDEVNTHSSLIACFLDPKGKHGCGKVLLDEFIRSLPKSFGLDDFFQDTSYCHPYIEYFIGKVSDDYTGGRIDILLESSDCKKAVIFENKIYASDGNKQLAKYSEFAQKKYGEGNYKIFYLTLKGHSPSKESAPNMTEGVDFFCISYADNIANWMRLCREKASSFPVVRETITQYINLILNLTHQNMENSIKEKIVNLFATGDNYKVILAMQNLHLDVIKKICENILVKQIQEVANDLDLKCDVKHNWGNKWGGQFFFKKESWRYFHLGFEFMNKDFYKWVYGITHQEEKYTTDNKLSNIRDYIFNNAKSQINPNCQKSNWWPCYFSFTPDNLCTIEAIEQIYNGTIKENMRKCIKNLLPLILDVQSQCAHI